MCKLPVFLNTHEELLQSALYTNAKKVSSAILKAIQTELNMNSLDLRTSVKTPPPEKKMLENIVSLILDALSSDMLNETESGRKTVKLMGTGQSMEIFFGWSGSNSFQKMLQTQRKNSLVRRIPLRKKLNQILFNNGFWKNLKQTWSKAQRTTEILIVPIIRNILNEIFQNALVNN